MNWFEYYFLTMSGWHGKIDSRTPTIMLFLLTINLFTLTLISAGWFVDIDYLWGIFLIIGFSAAITNLLFIVVLKTLHKQLHRAQDKFKKASENVKRRWRIIVRLYVATTIILFISSLCIVTVLKKAYGI